MDTGRKRRTAGYGRMRLKTAWIALILCLAFFSRTVCGASADISEDMDMEAYLQEAGSALRNLVQDCPIMALVYLSDEYPVRLEASYESAAAVTVSSGQLVEIEDFTVSEEGELWEYVRFYYGGAEYQGYIPDVYLACSDERFLEWKTTYGLDMEASLYSALDGVAGYADIDQFPESYRAALTALKQAHPHWTFVPLNTGLDWDTVIANEVIEGKSLIYKNQPACTREGQYDTGAWYYASEEILRYYMDPRNHLQENTIFQFELLSYNASYHTEGAVEQFLANTFMKSSQNAPGTKRTFASIFWEVGAQKKNVSPFHLATRVIQEQGQGTSPLISGTYPGYEGYYNYFNVNASGTTNEQIYQNGLEYAKKQGWTDAEKAILGGAGVISDNYIQRGQATGYLQKFNVNPNSYYSLYTHQYMQNIMAPFSESKNIMKLYDQAGALNSSFVFQIPVFLNMPASASPMPSSSNKVVLQIPSGYSTTVYLDGATYSGVSRNGRYIITAPDNKKTNAVVYRYNENGVPVGMYLWTLEYKNGAYEATPQPEMEDLLTYHGFSIRITGKAGIRFKTGFSTALRSKLTSSGVNGYVLKEYGTLVMNSANLSAYPMIKGGDKVLCGPAYGLGASGTLEDKIYETVDGRYRFTSVLVGLPADQYKTEYAFRGYAVLEKNGVQTIVYGPVMSRSIYALAEQALNMGLYQSGSEADNFLRKLIQDAR